MGPERQGHQRLLLVASVTVSRVYDHQKKVAEKILDMMDDHPTMTRDARVTAVANELTAAYLLGRDDEIRAAAAVPQDTIGA